MSFIFLPRGRMLVEEKKEVRKEEIGKEAGEGGETED